MLLADSNGAATGIGIVIYVAVLVLIIAGYWFTFTKAGQHGWTSIIPILNIFVLLKVVKRPLWWVILMLIPCVNIVVWIIVAIDLSKAFGHGGGFAVGLILLPPIFLLILGFGSSTYQLEPDPLF
jgi:hypothetical protein